MRSVRLGSTVLLAFLLVFLHMTPAQAATQYGCSFNVPKPSISGGKASFKVVVSCPSKYGLYKRQIVVDLMADDAVTDNVLKWTVVGATNAGTYTISRSGWPCQEDSVGNDEIYLRVRIERGGAGNVGWIKGDWVRGTTVSGNCY